MSQGAAAHVARTLQADTTSTSRTLPKPPRFNLRPDTPDFGSFPRDEWLKSYRAAVRRAPHRAFGYGDARGADALRQVLARYLGRARGVVADPEHLFVCGGFAQGVGLVASVLRRAGRRTIGVEDPGHAVVRTTIERTGLEPIPIAIDAEGLVVEKLAAAKPDAVLVTPAHQFPTGVVLAPGRRAELVDWAERTDAYVLEDDYDAEYRYDGAPVGAVQGLAPGRVFYLGSASKTLAPTLRLGWIASPPEFVWPLVHEVIATMFSPPQLGQLAFADFIERGELDRHLRRMRLVYRRRRDALVESLGRELPDAHVHGIAAGLHVLVALPDSVDETRVAEAARARQVGLYALGEHRIRTRGGPALLLGYAATSEPGLRAGVRELAAAVRAVSA
jgi:GntR family transcriptional regulator / MocR family aminotransferase